MAGGRQRVAIQQTARKAMRKTPCCLVLLLLFGLDGIVCQKTCEKEHESCLDYLKQKYTEIGDYSAALNPAMVDKTCKVALEKLDECENITRTCQMGKEAYNAVEAWWIRLDLICGAEPYCRRKLSECLSPVSGGPALITADTALRGKSQSDNKATNAAKPPFSKLCSLVKRAYPCIKALSGQDMCKRVSSVLKALDTYTEAKLECSKPVVVSNSAASKSRAATIVNMHWAPVAAIAMATSLLRH